MPLYKKRKFKVLLKGDLSPMTAQQQELVIEAVVALEKAFGHKLSVTNFFFNSHYTKDLQDETT